MVGPALHKATNRTAISSRFTRSRWTNSTSMLRPPRHRSASWSTATRWVARRLRRDTDGKTIASVRHGVEEDVDAKRIAFRGKTIEVPAIFAFALERVAEVGVVRDDHDDVAMRVLDGAHVRRL